MVGSTPAKRQTQHNEAFDRILGSRASPRSNLRGGGLLLCPLGSLRRLLPAPLRIAKLALFRLDSLAPGIRHLGHAFLLLCSLVGSALRLTQPTLRAGQ